MSVTLTRITELNFDQWQSLSLFYWLSNRFRHNNPVYKATTMPPAAEESHPPPGIHNEPEGAEVEEDDDYDIEVGGNDLFWPLSDHVLRMMMMMMMSMLEKKTAKTKRDQME